MGNVVVGGGCFQCCFVNLVRAIVCNKFLHIFIVFIPHIFVLTCF